MAASGDGNAGPEAMKLGQVDLNLLVVLDALLREKNVTRAAERLHLTQPAVSTALARLRKVLDDPLLVKSGRNLQMTPRAEALVDPVRDVLATIEQSIVRPPEFDPDRDRRSFSLIASDYVAVTLLRPLLARLTGLAADLRVDVVPVSDRYVTVLQRDEVDIAVLPDQMLEEAPLPDCSSAPVISDRFVGTVWSGHPRADDRLTVDLLASSPYLMWATSGGRAIFEQDLDRLAVPRHVTATASSFVSMAYMLAGTELVAILPEKLANRVADAAQIRLLEPDFPLRPLTQSAYWHTRRDCDPGHVWLRTQLLTVAEQSLR
jgi:DNA-binding transcriptional LysR family regulator